MEVKLKYSVEFSNTMQDLEKTGYQLPEHGPFESLEDANAFITEELEKAKALLLALPDGGGYRFYTGPASKSIRCETYGSCHWETIEVDEHGKRMIPTTFYPNEYVQKTYGLTEDGIYGVPEGMDIPYHGILLARSIDGEFKSCWERDDGIPFDESLAKKLIDDPEVEIGTNTGLIVRKSDLGSKYATDYYLPCTNPRSSIFMPTVHAPVSDACNVESDFTIEVLFAFDDGYVVPVVKHFKTRGPFAISVHDAMHDILEDLDGGLDELSDLFEDCGNFKKTEDGFSLYAFSADGLETDLEFDDSNYCDVRRALSSIRLVDLTEKITDRGLDDI